MGRQAVPNERGHKLCSGHNASFQCTGTMLASPSSLLPIPKRGNHTVPYVQGSAGKGWTAMQVRSTCRLSFPGYTKSQKSFLPTFFFFFGHVGKLGVYRVDLQSVCRVVARGLGRMGRDGKRTQGGVGTIPGPQPSSGDRMRVEDVQERGVGRMAPGQLVCKAQQMRIVGGRMQPR